MLETLKVIAHHGTNIDAASREMQTRNHLPRAGGEMIRGVHVCPLRSLTLPPLTHTNCYFLGEREMVIVDPASPFDDEQEKLLSYIEYLQDQGTVMKEIWITHHHHDHTGAVQMLREKLRIPVATHRATAEIIKYDIPVDRLLDDGQTYHFNFVEGPSSEWSALHTPGHANGHLCFYEKNTGTLLSGDHILGWGTAIIAPPDGNMADYLRSLERLRALRLGFIFPGHGPPVAAAHDRIDYYIAHRREREQDERPTEHPHAATPL